MSRACVYKYSIEYWDECKGANCVECGIAFGKTFSEAVRYLQEYHGAENIEGINELIAYGVSGEHILSEFSLESLGYKLSKK